MPGAQHQGPETTVDLEVGEQVALWSLRTRLEGMASFERTRESFCRAYDRASADLVSGVFEPWFLLLANHCRRDLHLHQPHCPCLGDDERDVLDIIARIQTGDTNGARHVAAKLLHERALVAFLGASLNLAPRPQPTGPARAPPPARDPVCRHHPLIPRGWRRFGQRQDRDHCRPDAPRRGRALRPRPRPVGVRRFARLEIGQALVHRRPRPRSRLLPPPDRGRRARISYTTRPARSDRPEGRRD